MELTGKIINVLPTQSGQGRNGEWVKNSFVIEWLDNNYKQHLLLEVVGAEKWDKMKPNIVIGKDVLVKFSVTSREWNGKWFTGCQCYYCAAIGGQNNHQPQQNVQAPPTSTNYNENTPF